MQKKLNSFIKQTTFVCFPTIFLKNSSFKSLNGKHGKAFQQILMSFPSKKDLMFVKLLRRSGRIVTHDVPRGYFLMCHVFKMLSFHLFLDPSAINPHIGKREIKSGFIPGTPHIVLPENSLLGFCASFSILLVNMNYFFQINRSLK